jgi:putative toxin-antitoxin system antitoxin component (TIGR02293 family)
MQPDATSLDRIVRKAAEVLGSREAAESWMLRPAVGLDQQRPIDVLRTASGTEIVEDFLTRLEFNVYC